MGQAATSQLSQSLSDEFSGIGSAFTETLTGLTGGGFNYTETKRNFANLATDVSGVGQRTLSQTQINQQKIAVRSDTFVNNAALWQGSGVSGRTNVSYSGQSGLGNVVSPSQINSISDPSAKMAIATARGSGKAALNTVNIAQDNQAAPAIAVANST